MATSTTDKTRSRKTSGGEWVEYDEFIDLQIRKTRGQVKGVEIATALMTLAAGALAFFLVAAVFDHWVLPHGLGFWGRLLCLLMFLGGAGYYAADRLLPWLIYRVNPIYAAQAIEKSRPTLKNSLINFLFLRGQSSRMPAAVYQAIEEQAATGLSRVQVEAAVDRTRLIHIGYALLAIVGLFAAYFLFSPKNPWDTVGRVMLPWADIQAPTRVGILDVQPGNRSVYRGATVEVSAEIKELKEDEPVRVVYSTADHESVDQPVAMYLPRDRFRHVAKIPAPSAAAGQDGGVQQNIDYRIEAGDAVSPTYHLIAVTAPTIALESVDYQYPDYTGRQRITLKGIGDIQSLEGTRVVIHGRANEKIKSAELELDGREGRTKLPMQIGSDGRSVTGRFTLALESDRVTPQFSHYRMRPEGRADPEPVQYRIDVIADLPPEVKFILPEKDDVALPVNRRLTLRLRALDPDFALSGVMLSAESNRNRIVEQTLLNEIRRVPMQVDYWIDPQKLHLKPGDVVDYWATAMDNREPTHNATATSPRHIHIIAADARAGNSAQGQGDGSNQGNPDGQGNNADASDKAGASKTQHGEQPNQNTPAGQHKPDDQPQQGQPNKSQPSQKSSDAQNSADKQQQNPAEQNPSRGKQSPDQQKRQDGQKGGAKQGERSQQDQSQQNQSQQNKNGGSDQQKPDNKQDSANQKSGEKQQQQGGGSSKSGGNQSQSKSGSEKGGSDSNSGGNNSSGGNNAAGNSQGANNSNGAGPNGNQSNAAQQSRGGAQQNANQQTQSSKAAGDGSDDAQMLREILKQAKENKSGNNGKNGAQQSQSQNSSDGSQKPAGQNAQGSKQQSGNENQSGGQKQSDSQHLPNSEPKPGDRTGPQNAQKSSTQNSQQKPGGEGAKSADGQNHGQGASSTKNGEPKPQQSGANGQQGDKTQGGQAQGTKSNGGNGAANKPNGTQETRQQGDAKNSVDKHGSAQKAGEKSPDKSNGANSPNEQAPNDQSANGANSKSGEKKPGDKSAQESPKDHRESGEGQNRSANGNQQKQGNGERATNGSQPTADQHKAQGDSQTAGAKGGDADSRKGQSGAGQDNTKDDQPTPPSPSDANKPRGKKPQPSDGPGKKEMKSKDSGAASTVSPKESSRSKSSPQQDGTFSGGGGKGGGQGANQSGTGGAGQNTGADQGNGVSGGHGQGDKSNQAGSDKKSDHKTGQSGHEKGNGSHTSAASDHPNSPNPAQSQEAGQPNSQSAKGQNGKNSANPNNEQGGGWTQNTGGGGAYDPKTPPPPQTGGTGDPANAKFAKKQFDMALETLKKGKPDLLKELNWTPEEAQKLADRLERMRRNAELPGEKGDVARRKMDDILHSLGERSGQLDRRSGGNATDSQRGLRESHDAGPPPEYSEQVEAFQQGILQGGK